MQNLKSVIHPEIGGVALLVKFKGHGIDSFVEAIDPKEHVVSRKCSDGMVHLFARAQSKAWQAGGPIRVDYDLLPDDDPRAIHES